MRSSVLVVTLAGLIAQDRQQSTTDGIYSPAQAERGRARYEATCQGCHAADLSGGVGSALRGDKFLSDWSGLPLARLFERIRTMPPNAQAPQTEEATADLLAYVLAANKFPSGEALHVDRVEHIRFATGDAPDAVPDFALVQVLGCIRRETADEWVVTAAQAAVRTRDPEPSAPDRRREAHIRGTETFRLMNAYPKPDKLEGHLAEVKGFLIRGARNSINVTAITDVAPTCP